MHHHQHQAYKNAGRFGLLQAELIQDLVTHHLPARDQLALGRSCKWLRSIVQHSSAAWQMLFHPSAPLLELTRPVLGTNSLPTPLKPGFIACLPIGRLPSQLAWVAREQTSVCFRDAIFAGSLVAIQRRPPPRLSSAPFARPSNIEGGFSCVNECFCQCCGWDVVNNLSLHLPLFLNQDHFDSSFPLLYDQVSCAILDGQSLDSPPSLPYSLVTSFFPQLVRNMAARLALTANLPTANDLETLVQVQALWRATIHRFNRNSMAWVTEKIRTQIDSLSRGGQRARQVPLMELVSLLHVSTGSSGREEWTWLKIAHMIVQENTIRLFEYIRACRGCNNKVPSLVRLPENALWLANKVAEGRFDGCGFVPWQILLFHVRILRATSSLLTNKSPSPAFARIAGRLDREQHLVPGPLARLLHAYLVQQARSPNGACSSWAGIWRGLGAAPMQPAALTKWLDWCFTQAKLRPANVQRVGLINSPYFPQICPICPLPRRRHPDRPLSLVTFHPTHRFSLFSPPRVALPVAEFTLIALNRKGAFLYAHSNTFGVHGMDSGFLSLHIEPTPHGSQETTLHLDKLDPTVAYVAVVTSHSKPASDPYPSTVYATSTDIRECPESWGPQDTQALPKMVSRLSWVCCRGLDDGKWDLVRATAVPRNGGRVVMWYDSSPGRHAWLISRQGSASRDLEDASNFDVTLANCVDVTQQWVLEYVKLCQVNGLDSHGVSRTESHP